MNSIKDSLYADVKIIVEQARGHAVKAVNIAMVTAYWEIGKRIVEDEQGGNKRAGYGEAVLKGLSKILTAEFGKGFSLANLKNFRLFYSLFPIHQKSYALRSQLVENIKLRPELSWTHYRLLIRVENKDAREYYMNEAAEQNWSTRVLERQINTLYFERLLSSKNKKPLVEKTKTEAEEDKPSILDFVEDPYVLEFLNLQSNATLFEKELETELLNKLQAFLLELGKGYSFVARQKRISAEEEHFYIDLVFYNYILKCFVLIDLKVGKLTHQDIGQMDLYVRYYEDNLKQETDNPTIGIILCAEKNETVVKYSILKESKQLFASKYKLYLPTEKEWIQELKEDVANYIAEKQKDEPKYKSNPK